MNVVDDCPVCGRDVVENPEPPPMTACVGCGRQPDRCDCKTVEEAQEVDRAA